MIFFITAAALLLVSIYLALMYAPDATSFSAPKAQRIFYFHVPMAWVSYLAFGIVFVASLVILYKNDPRFGCVAYCSAEIGVVFCTLAIVTGMIWGKAEWGAYWRFEDTRLTVTFILWLIYLAYLMLYQGIDNPEKRGRLTAVFGIMGFITVPLSYISALIWASLHPMPVAKGTISTVMLSILIVAVISFTLLFLAMFLKRVQIERLRVDLEDLRDELGGVDNDKW